MRPRGDERNAIGNLRVRDGSIAQAPVSPRPSHAVVSRRAHGLVWLLLAGCAARLPPPRAPRPAPAVATPERVVPPSPCQGLSGLVIVPPAPIAARWSSPDELLTGGEGTATLRWCGEGRLTIQRGEAVSAERPSGLARMQYNFDPFFGLLSPDESFELPVHGSVAPETLRLTITALTEDGRTVTAQAPIVSVESPDLARARAECVAARGTMSSGWRGGFFCDRPTRDGGRRCLQDSDCEVACAPDHTEAVAVAPDGHTCPAGRQLRLEVGTCYGRSLYSECVPRLRTIDMYCHAPGMLRAHGSRCVE